MTDSDTAQLISQQSSLQKLSHDKTKNTNSAVKSDFLSLMEVPQETTTHIDNLTARNLAFIIKYIYAIYPDMRACIDNKLVEANTNQQADKVQQLIDEANLPLSPNHAKLSDFDSSCLNEQDKEFFNRLIKLDFLYSDCPNITILGPKRFGAEKLACGLGDAICHNLHKVYYIKFRHLISILIIRGRSSKGNSDYNELLKKECLIIEDFAGDAIHDIDLLSTLEAFLEARLDNHLNSFNKAISKTGRKKTYEADIVLEKKFKPCVTIITTCRSYEEWARFFDCDKLKAASIMALFHGSGHILYVDETNKPDA